MYPELAILRDVFRSRAIIWNQIPFHEIIKVPLPVLRASAEYNGRRPATIHAPALQRNRRCAGQLTHLLRIGEKRPALTKRDPCRPDVRRSRPDDTLA